MDRIGRITHKERKWHCEKWSINYSLGIYSYKEYKTIFDYKKHVQPLPAKGIEMWKGSHTSCRKEVIVQKRKKLSWKTNACFLSQLKTLFEKRTLVFIIRQKICCQKNVGFYFQTKNFIVNERWFFEPDKKLYDKRTLVFSSRQIIVW